MTQRDTIQYQVDIGIKSQLCLPSSLSALNPVGKARTIVVVVTERIVMAKEDDKLDEESEDLVIMLY